jgi:hypothetical protein
MQYEKTLCVREKQSTIFSANKNVIQSKKVGKSKHTLEKSAKQHHEQKHFQTRNLS